MQWINLFASRPRARSRGSQGTATLVTMIATLAVAALSACASPVSPVGPDQAPVARIDLLPGEAELEPTESMRFFADLRDANGNPVSDVISWDADGGTIDANGIYVAGSAAGDYEVRATSRFHDWIAAARVRIRPRAPGTTTSEPTVASVSLSPGSATVIAGKTAAFTAAVSDAQGNPVNVSVTWSATGGTISSSGSYTAGSQPGTYAVQATAGGRSASATVQVTAPATTPPPAPAPVNGIPISPGQSIQAAVNANPAGTTFVIKAGRHVRQSVEPKDGDTFVGEAGAILDGQGLNIYAFGHYGLGSRNVTVRGLVIENYATPVAEGAIQGDNTFDWTVENNEVRNNAGFGIRAGQGMRVLNNHAHHNGDAGIGGYKSHGALIEGNEVDHNADVGYQAPAVATAAGMKFVRGQNLVIRNNYVHDNPKRGIWCDTDVVNVLIENNHVANNGGYGIWQEIGGKATIRNNVVEGNSFAAGTGAGWLDGLGIAVTLSTDVEIYGNTVRGNVGGIGAMAATGYPAGHELRNLYVHDNTIELTKGRSGIVSNMGDASIYTSNNNRFQNNHYTLGSGDSWFLWMDGARTVQQWKGYGNDVNGTF